MTVLRDAVETEYEDIVFNERAQHGWRFERRNRNRTVDWWLIMSIKTAIRSIHLGRYRNPAVHRAIVEARDAVSKAESLIRRDYWERKDTYDNEHPIAPVSRD